MATSPSIGNASSTANINQSPINHASDGGAIPSPVRSTKRQKITRACDSCKSRKRRCTGEIPCAACHASGGNCTYLASYTRGKLVQPLPAVRLDENGTGTIDRPISNGPYLTVATNGTESNGRPSRANSPEASTNYAGQYLGPASPYTFLRRAWKRFEQDGANVNFAGGATEESRQSEPIFAFGDRQLPSTDASDFKFPDRSVTSQLLSQYFELGMPTYRFLHQQTVAQWLETYHQLEELGADRVSLLPARQAVVLMVLATARLLNVDENNERLSPTEQSYREGEKLFRVGQNKLEEECGRARLESVQARLAAVLYSLHISRPNQAWYQFGTTAQLALTLGLHRATTGATIQQDAVVRECRKRVFWATSTLDTYLSVILGRPALIHLDDVDQKLPDPIEDEDLSENSTTVLPGGDSVINASIMHAKITRILKKAAREQYSVLRKTNQQKLDSATKLSGEVSAWHAALPVVLSGAIHPSSLIPIFRRQITVLQLAHGHAQMLINRPSLLMDTSQVALKEAQVETCLSAAKSTLNTILAAGLGKPLFQAFWFTQFVAFNALSIVYVWFILRKHGRLLALKSTSEDELTRLAEAVQQRLGEASELNAPSLRYNIVLQELEQEVQRLNIKVGQRPPHLSGLIMPPTAGSASLLNVDSMNPSDRLINSTDFTPADPFLESFAADFPLDPDLWLSLDSFPFSDFGQLE